MCDSDSDETDILLLIPPNFFSMQRKEESEYQITSEMSFEIKTPETNIIDFKTEDFDTSQVLSISPSKDSINKYQNKFVFLTPKEFKRPELCTQSKFDSLLNNPDGTAEIHNFKYVHKTQSIPLLDVDNMSLEDRCAAISEKHYYDLVSLSDMWSNENSSGRMTIDEERLRREHCEWVIRALQSKLLEYQQKMSVAIEVDKAKLTIIITKEEENQRLRNKIQNADEQCLQLAREKNELKWKYESLEKELSEAECLATTFEQKNRTLAIELTQLSQVHQAEKILEDECIKLKDLLQSTKETSENALRKIEELKNDNVILNDNINLVTKKELKEKERADQLQSQNDELNKILHDFRCKDKELLIKMDNQQQILKNHYQEELEKAVHFKLTEYQTELDKMELSLKCKGKERERIIAERAFKQLEFMNEKHKQEIQLLQEKCNAEIELSRIQLSNAIRKVEGLELKLTMYKSKRADIVQKLHEVMEIQWQKAVEILVSPNNSLSQEASQNSDKENVMLESPTTIGNENGANKKQFQDKLQAYVDLLLSKMNSEDFSSTSKIPHKSEKERHYKSPWR